MMGRDIRVLKARQDSVLVAKAIPAAKGRAGRMAAGKETRIRRSPRVGVEVSAKATLSPNEVPMQMVAGWCRLTERGGIRSETGATGGLKVEMLSTSSREDKVNNANQGIDI